MLLGHLRPVSNHFVRLSTLPSHFLTFRGLHPLYPFPSPHTHTIMTSRLSQAISMLQQLIKEVEALPTAGGSSSTSSSSNPSLDMAWNPAVPPGHTAFSWSGPSHGGDKAWSPATPPGHTELSWGTKQPTAQAPSQKGSNPSQAASNKSKKEEKAAAQEQNPQKSQKKEKSQKPQQQQQKKQKGGPSQQTFSADMPPFYRLDIRVGKIVKAWKHANADTMYVEQIDLGEDQPRQVCSGLYGKIPQDKFEGSAVLTVVNLKPSALRGITSYGMVLAASNTDKSVIELVQPPKSTPVGARVFLDGDDDTKLEKWVAEENVNGKKDNSAWKVIAPDLAVNGEGVVTWQGRPLRTVDGLITSPTLKNVHVS